MFISKKTLQSEIEKLTKFYELQIAQRDFRIQDLKEQIQDLKQLIFIPKSDPAPEVYEADAVISASEKPFTMSEEERTAILEGAREMDLIVSGNYDTDLIN